MKNNTDAFPGREINVNGKNYLYFGGTAYLGLQTNSDFQYLFIQNIKKYGTNYSASRKSNIKIDIFEKAEAILGDLVVSEACTTLSSGYLAGQLVSKHFNSEAFECFYAPNSHSALFQNETTSFQNFNDLISAVKESNKDKTPVVFFDSIDTLETTYPSFEGLEGLPLNDVILVVDDSHGIGIMGENGSGAYQVIKKLRPKEIIVCCSLGKGFGIQAGAVFGKQSRIEQLTNTDFYGGASPAIPAALATYSEGLPIYQKQRDKLKENVDLFLNEIKMLDSLQYIQEHPVFSFENSELVDYLKENGVLITNFKYPNDEGILKSRIVISASHTKEDIMILVKLLNTY